MAHAPNLADSTNRSGRKYDKTTLNRFVHSMRIARPHTFQALDHVDAEYAQHAAE